jgi:hypothetical protein
MSLKGPFGFKALHSLLLRNLRLLVTIVQVSLYPLAHTHVTMVTGEHLVAYVIFMLLLQAPSCAGSSCRCRLQAHVAGSVKDY